MFDFDGILLEIVGEYFDSDVDGFEFGGRSMVFTLAKVVEELQSGIGTCRGA